MASGSAGYEAAVYQPVADAGEQVKLHGEMPMVVNGIDVSDNPVVGGMTAMAHSLKQFFTAFFELKARLPHGAAWDPVRKTADDAYGEAFDFTVEFSKSLRGLQMVPHDAKELEKHLGVQAKFLKNEKLTKEKLMAKFKFDPTVKHLEVLNSVAEKGYKQVKEATKVLTNMIGKEKSLVNCMKDLDGKTEARVKAQNKLDECLKALAIQTGRQIAYTKTLEQLDQMLEDKDADWKHHEHFLQEESRRLQDVINRGPDEDEERQYGGWGFFFWPRRTEVVRKKNYGGMNLAKESAKEVRENLENILKSKQNRSDALAEWKKDATHKKEEAAVMVEAEKDKLATLKKELENAIASMEEAKQNLEKLAKELGTKDANVCIQAGVALDMFAKTLAGGSLEAVSSDVTLTTIITTLTERIDTVADLDSARDQMDAVQELMGDLQEGNETDPMSIGMSLQWMARQGSKFRPLSNQPVMAVVDKQEALEVD